MRTPVSPRLRAGLAALLAATTAVVLPGGTAHATALDDSISAQLPAHFAAANSYAAGRPGTTGIVVIDRQTGRTLTNAFADTAVWTASTIKLAIAADLIERDHAGLIHLTSADRTDMHTMLNTSDDDATDRLWFAYAGADHMTFNNDFRKFGMLALAPQRGFTQFYPYWGFQKDTPHDFANLVSYVLRMPAADRNYLVGEMRGVAPDQQWGILAAPRQLLPGNKDGWSDEQGGSVINSIGFVGAGERFVVTMMNSLNGQGNQDDGRVTVSQVSRDLFS